MKKIGKVMLVSLLIGTTVVTPVFAEPNVSELEQDKENAQQEVNALQEELRIVTKKMNKLETQLIETGQETQRVEQELIAAREKAQQQYKDMKLRMQYMYEKGDFGFLHMMMSAENFADFLNKAVYAQKIYTYDRKMLDEYAKNMQRIEKLQGQLNTEMAHLETLQTEYQDEQESLNKTLIEKQNQVSDLSEQLQAAVEAAAREEQEKNASDHAASNNTGSSAANNSTSNNADNSTNSNTDNNSQNDTVEPTTPPADNNNNQNTGDGSAIVAGAQRYLGVPYVWGGNSQSGVDCSGLVYLAHQSAGIAVPRYSGSLGAGGKSVLSPLPGDVVCYSGHVGIYVGNGQMIHAPQPGKVVCYANVNYAPHWYRRYW